MAGAKRFFKRRGSTNPGRNYCSTPSFRHPRPAIARPHSTKHETAYKTPGASNRSAKLNAPPNPLPHRSLILVIGCESRRESRHRVKPSQRAPNPSKFAPACARRPKRPKQTCTNSRPQTLAYKLRTGTNLHRFAPPRGRHPSAGPTRGGGCKFGQVWSPLTEVKIGSKSDLLWSFVWTWCIIDGPPVAARRVLSRAATNSANAFKTPSSASGTLPVGVHPNRQSLGCGICAVPSRRSVGNNFQERGIVGRKVLRSERPFTGVSGHSGPKIAKKSQKESFWGSAKKVPENT